MARRKVLLTLGFLVLLGSGGLIPRSSAHNSAGVSPPPECSKFVPGGGDTSHATSVTDFLGNVRSTYGLGESVNVHASASSSLGDTDVNRVKFVWIDRDRHSGARDSERGTEFLRVERGRWSHGGGKREHESGRYVDGLHVLRDAEQHKGPRCHASH